MPLPRSSILMPLYIYPLTADTWAPLYRAIELHPSLSFTVVINPNSGPDAAAPDENYVREIARLNQYPNVTTVGYVRIDYCKRDIRKVLQDIDLYAKWAGLNAEGAVVTEAARPDYASNGSGDALRKPEVKAKPWHLKSLQVLRDRSPFRSHSRSRSRSKSPNPTPRPAHAGHNTDNSFLTSATLDETSTPRLGAPPSKDRQQPPNGELNSIVNPKLTPPRRPLQMDGIFFDETPNMFSEPVAEYLDCIAFGVKHSLGIGGHKIVLHNPGTMPDAELVMPGFESNRGGERIVPDVTAVFEAGYGEYITPSDWMVSQMARCRLGHERKAYFVHSVPVDRVPHITQELRRVAGHVFVTDLSQGFYCNFDRSWEVFVQAMAK